MQQNLQDRCSYPTQSRQVQTEAESDTCNNINCFRILFFFRQHESYESISQTKKAAQRPKNRPGKRPKNRPGNCHNSLLGWGLWASAASLPPPSHWTGWQRMHPHPHANMSSSITHIFHSLRIQLLPYLFSYPRNVSLSSPQGFHMKALPRQLSQVWNMKRLHDKGFYQILLHGIKVNLGVLQEQKTK